MLEASTRILMEHGRGALTTNAIAERAGVSVGSLYQYYPSSDAVLVALIRRFETSMHSQMHKALAMSTGGFSQQLTMLVQTALNCHFELPRLTAILEVEEIRLGPMAQPYLASAEAEMTDFIRAFVRRHAAVTNTDADRVAHRMEIVGRALVDDALRSADVHSGVAAEIAATMSACAPSHYWKTRVDRR